MSAPPPTPAGFSVRCLRTEEELSGPWLDLVVAVFGPLGIPRSYFARHWTSDTDESKRLEGIFVAVDDATGQFVATVRVFRRTLRTRANGAVAVGGFGEVSTLPAYRRRGLATALLRAALRWHENEGLWYSALHAASAAAGIYRSLGFAEVPTPIFFLELDADAAAETRLPGELEVSEPVRSSLEDIELFAEEAVAASVISEFSFEDDAAWSMAVTRLMPLQARFVATSGLECYARSEQYWARWVRLPAEGLDAKGEPTEGLLRGYEVVDEAGATQAYMIAKAGQSFSGGAEEAEGSDGGSGEEARLVVLDFGSVAPAGSEGSEALLFRLLQHARGALLGAPGRGDRLVDLRVVAAVPALLAPAACARPGAVLDEAQGTWMYMDVSGGGGGAALVVRPEAHLVLAIDEF